jgi:hypothetical protein
MGQKTTADLVDPATLATNHSIYPSTLMLWDFLQLNASGKLLFGLRLYSRLCSKDK